MYEPLKYNGTYVYPTWGYVLGWGMAVASMIQIPLYAIYRLVRAEGTLKEVGIYVIQQCEKGCDVTFEKSS